MRNDPSSSSLHGQLTNEIQNGVSISRSYDALARSAGYRLMHNGGASPPGEPFAVSYACDAPGRLASVSASNILHSPFSIFHYSYLPGTDLVSGYASGNFTRSVAYEPHRDLVASVANSFNDSTPSTISIFAYLNDANGNVSEYVSINGSIVAHYDYSPFGETLIESGDLASAFTHRFSTKPWCPVTGLCEYQMRKYRPGIGRWLSRDPIGEKSDELSIYAYLGNSSLAGSDYLGLMWNFRLIRFPSRPPAKTKKRPCCGDTTYDPETECCLEEEYDDGEELALGIGEVREGPTPMEELPRKTRFVVRKNTPIGTGVFKGKWEGAYNGRRNVVHYWISWPGGSVDANALDDKIVHSPALRAYSRFDQGVKLTEVKLSPCLYDIEVYITCIKRKAEFWREKNYQGMCYDFVASVCSSCEQEARR